MILDRVEWDEDNLDHVTKRLTAVEIEQAIWNADRMFPHRQHAERALIRSVTDGGGLSWSSSGLSETEYDRSRAGRRRGE